MVVLEKSQEVKLPAPSVYGFSHSYSKDCVYFWVGIILATFFLIFNLICHLFVPRGYVKILLFSAFVSLHSRFKFQGKTHDLISLAWIIHWFQARGWWAIWRDSPTKTMWWKKRRFPSKSPSVSLRFRESRHWAGKIQTTIVVMWAFGRMNAA